MATIRKRGERQWEARIRRKGYPVTCRTFDNRGDAEKWSREIESEMDRGLFVTRREAESTTLYEVFERYIQDYVPKQAQADTVTCQIRALQRHPLSTKFMAAIRSKDIAEYIREREEQGRGGNTINHELALISRVFSIAASDYGMENITNPVAKVSKPKLPQGRTRRLEEGEFEALLKKSPSRLHRILRFAVESAMRRGEIVALTWNNVNIERRTVFLP